MYGQVQDWVYDRSAYIHVFFYYILLGAGCDKEEDSLKKGQKLQKASITTTF